MCVGVDVGVGVGMGVGLGVGMGVDVCFLCFVLPGTLLTLLSNNIYGRIFAYLQPLSHASNISIIRTHTCTHIHTHAHTHTLSHKHTHLHTHRRQSRTPH